MGTSIDDWQMYIDMERGALLTESPSELAARYWFAAGGDYDFPVFLRFDAGRHEIVFNVGVIKLYESRLPSRLMKALSEKPGVSVSIDELWERMFPDEEFAKSEWHRVYSAASRINQKVHRELGFSEFLLVFKKTVQINEKYVP